MADGLTPWYKVATPREDLRRRQPLDAAQFAVHLDQVVQGEAPAEYRDPERFFSRTLLTQGLRRFAGEVIRRLSGERVGANAVLNLTTEFGGGKTHALTTLYHLATLGPEASSLPGVRQLLEDARVDEMPQAAVAVFVGTAWSPYGVRPRGGEPARLTPWGELAWQLARATGDRSLFEAVAVSDENRSRPGKDTIRRFLPPGRPVLILMDEVMNFMTAARAVAVGDSTLASQFYSFVHNLTEVADASDRVVVVVSLPASEQEMSAEDEQDFKRLAKVTARVAEPYKLATGDEIAEIIRRRLFDNVGERHEIDRTARAYARWVRAHRDQLPLWFPIDRAEEAFAATYPFHPAVISIFERKWQALPSFQRTRGILRLLAQWVGDAYEDGYRERHTDPLITLGTAPLDDQFFRTAVLEQLGEDRLAPAILSDIAGEESHAERLDADATDTFRRLRLHRKVATVIFFESSGGQQRQEATVPEVRLAVGEPDLEVGYVETVLAALQDACYYLAWEGNRYRFSTKPNLNKLLADRRAALDPADVEECAREAVRRVFSERKGVAVPFELVWFPEEPTDVPDALGIRLVVLPPDRPWGEETRAFVERILREHGASARRFPNSLVFAVLDRSARLLDAARRKLAWESIGEEAGQREFGEEDRRQIEQQIGRAKRDLEEAVWRAYNHLAFLGKNGQLSAEELGVLHSSSAESMQALIQRRLKARDELTDYLAPSRVVQNWPPGAREWSTRALRDAVYASPKFTRLLRPEALKDTVTRGVREGVFGYAARCDGHYVSAFFEEPLPPEKVEFSDDVVLILPEQARTLKEAAPSPEKPVPGLRPEGERDEVQPVAERQPPTFTGQKVARLVWEGEIPWQKWTQFFTKVLQRLSSGPSLTIRVRFEARPPGGLSHEHVNQVREGLGELGLPSDVETEELPDAS